jgi:hypothetical protein
MSCSLDSNEKALKTIVEALQIEGTEIEEQKLEGSN